VISAPFERAAIVTNTQVTLIQIDNYGPWTVTPTPRRETDLQALQAELYADLSRLIGAEEGYVFFARFDNVVAITNGMDAEALEHLQSTIGNRYPVTVSVSTARAATPATALGEATDALQASGSAQEAARSEAFLGHPDERTHAGDVQLAHFDVVDATKRLTDTVDAFAAFAQVERAHVELLEYAHEAHDALTFFVGGDNFIAVTPDLDRGEFEALIAHVASAAGVELRVGVGRGETAHTAGMTAKHALERCREQDRLVAGDCPAPAEQ